MTETKIWANEHWFNATMHRTDRFEDVITQGAEYVQSDTIDEILGDGDMTLRKMLQVAYMAGAVDSMLGVDLELDVKDGKVAVDITSLIFESSIFLKSSHRHSYVMAADAGHQSAVMSLKVTREDGTVEEGSLDIKDKT